MKLSNQAIGAIMMTLQKGLLEKIDVVELFKSMNLVKASDTKKWGTKAGELDVKNPPVVRVDHPTPADSTEEE
jgi:hypothetical protein